MFYLFGLVVGMVLVYLFFGQRTNLPAVWPEGKVKEKISRSTLVRDSLSSCLLNCIHVDDLRLKDMIVAGDVNFRESTVRDVPHPVYAIDVKIPSGASARLTIESADSTFSLLSVNSVLTADSSFCNCK